MRIERPAYLEKVKKLMGNGLVKVITGIRRCGKSYFLFTIFRDYLLSVGVEADQIVEVHLDEADYEELCTPRELSKYVKDRILKDGRTTYVLIDEIQECKPPKGDALTFYEVLSSLMKKADVYVTGSNSEMLDVGVVSVVGKKDGRSARSDYEVDFVVNRGAKRIYIQSALEMSDADKRDSERRSLLLTGDYFRKIIVTGGNDRLSVDEDGIFRVGVIPFMLDDAILGV